MEIIGLDKYRDGGTIGITVSGTTYNEYRCNPGIRGTTYCLSLESNYNKYSGPNIGVSEASELLLALKNHISATQYEVSCVNKVIEVIYKLYPELNRVESLLSNK